MRRPQRAHAAFAEKEITYEGMIHFDHLREFSVDQDALLGQHGNARGQRYQRVEVMRQGKVRRAKLYYLRGKKGKFAKVEDREFVASPKAKAGVARKVEAPAEAAAAPKA